MGQRHMTYIVAEAKTVVAKGQVKITDSAIGRYYHQWNHATAQVPKILRYENWLKQLNKDELYSHCLPEYTLGYTYAGALAPVGLQPFIDETA